MGQDRKTPLRLVKKNGVVEPADERTELQFNYSLNT